MNTNTTALLLSAAMLATVSGCVDEEPESPRHAVYQDQLTYQVCGKEINEAELVRFLDGNLVVVASHAEQGYSAGMMVGSLVLGLVLNGIDLNNLDYEPEFADGRYQVTNGDAFVGFSLYYTQDFNGHEAGDVIGDNVFAMSSYVRNFRITSFDPVGGTFSYDYDPGPLHDMVEGELDIDVDNIASASIKVRIRTDLVAFEAESQKTINGRPPRTDDTLRVVMTTTRAPLNDIVTQFREGGYGFSYTGTSYDSVFFGIEQQFTDSLFLMKQTDEGGWIWEGDYKSTVDKSDQIMFQSGFVSSAEQNYTAYYCDEELTERVGVANHDLNLTGGEFVFESGRSVRYGLGPF